MAIRLTYQGAEPSDPAGVVTRGQGRDIINTAPVNRTQTVIDIEAAASNRAAKEYIDLADGGFATADYYQQRDLLNIPNSARGAPNGVASLVSGRIPVGQVPVLGTDLIKGPFGPTSITPVSSVTTTPVKFADFAIGVQNVAFQPLGYAVVAVDTTPGGRPVIDMRLNNVLIAQGVGWALHNGRQIVTVTPASETLGAANPSPFALSTNIAVTLHISSTSAIPVAVGSTSVLSAAVLLLRMAA